MAPRHRLLTLSPWHGRNSAPGELSPLCADAESGGGTGAHWGTIVGAQNAPRRCRDPFTVARVRGKAWYVWGTRLSADAK